MTSIDQRTCHKYRFVMIGHWSLAINWSLVPDCSENYELLCGVTAHAHRKCLFTIEHNKVDVLLWLSSTFFELQDKGHRRN